MKRTFAQRLHLSNYAVKSALAGGHRAAPLGASRAPAVYHSTGRTSVVLSKKKSTSDHSIALDTNPVKGTRDFFPDDQRMQSWLFKQWRNAASKHGFEEYDAPVVEQASLYTRKAGEEITQQLYSFQDKSGRHLSLRPEMTPSLARMVLAKGKALSLPLKWFSTPQCWRYEKMSRGRRREHYQWNMDIWGIPGVEAEAEVLSALVSSLRAMGLTSRDVGIRMNSKKIIDAVLETFDIGVDDRAAVCILVDKWDKIPRETLHEEVQKVLPNHSHCQVNQLLDTINMKELNDFKAVLGNRNAGVMDIERLMLLADAYGYVDWLEFDATIVRGLSYYTGIVFEAFDRKGDFRAICGGGRYDYLLDSFTSGSDTRSIPAVGFGFGDAVIMELLGSKDLLPDMRAVPVVDVVVCALTHGETLEIQNKLQREAIKAATNLREGGHRVELVIENKRAKWMFKRADKLNAGLTLMFASKELEGGCAVLKDMKQGTQRMVDLRKVAEEVTLSCHPK